MSSAKSFDAHWPKPNSIARKRRSCSVSVFGSCVTVCSAYVLMSRNSSMHLRFMIDSDGWCNGAQRVPSPNCDARPDNTSVDLLVIHNISLPPGEFGGDYIADLFLNR